MIRKLQMKIKRLKMMSMTRFLKVMRIPISKHKAKSLRHLSSKKRRKRSA